MEDIITVLDGSPKILLEDKLGDLEKSIRQFLESSFSSFLINQDFKNGLVGSIYDRANASERAAAVLKRFENLCKILRGSHA